MFLYFYISIDTGALVRTTGVKDPSACLASLTLGNHSYAFVFYYAIILYMICYHNFSQACWTLNIADNKHSYSGNQYKIPPQLDTTENTSSDTDTISMFGLLCVRQPCIFQTQIHLQVQSEGLVLWWLCRNQNALWVKPKSDFFQVWVEGWNIL